MFRYLTLLFFLLVNACSSIGPVTVTNDQFNYNGAIAEAAHEQLLLNMVRLRYSESMSFLKVSSVISQYTRTASVEGGVGFNSSSTGADVGNLGGVLRWSDRPVITYVPLTGQEFSEEMLTPILSDRLIELLQSGWPAARVLRTAVLSINDVSNDLALPQRRREADPEFYELITLIQKLGELGLVQMRTKVADGSAHHVMFAKLSTENDGEEQLARFREILKLDPGIEEFFFVYGKTRSRPDEVAIQTGSMWDIMTNLCWQFKVPNEHIESGRTATTFKSTRLDHVPPIRVRFSKSRPESAFVEVFAHDYWFYIDQDDRKSKDYFTFLELLLSLTESTAPVQAPVITISN